MSGDFSEQDRRGLAEWLDDCGVPDQRDVAGRDVAGREVAGREVPGRRDVLDQRGGPAYVVSFGWLPARLPPAPLIPAPRQAGDDVPGGDVSGDDVPGGGLR